MVALALLHMAGDSGAQSLTVASSPLGDPLSERVALPLPLSGEEWVLSYLPSADAHRKSLSLISALTLG